MFSFSVFFILITDYQIDNHCKMYLPSMPKYESVLMFLVNVLSVYALYTTFVYSPPRRPLPFPKYSSEWLRKVEKN